MADVWNEGVFNKVVADHGTAMWPGGEDLSQTICATGPYAVLVMLGIKRAENRGTRPAAESGRCAASCSKSFCKEGYGAFARRAAQALGERVASAEDAARLFRLAMPVVGGNEGFFVMALDGERKSLSAPVVVSMVTEPNTTAVSTGDVFREAIKVGVEAIIVAHNHPGGTPRASSDDVTLTRELTKAGELLGVRLLDHLLVTKDGFARVTTRCNVRMPCDGAHAEAKRRIVADVISIVVRGKTYEALKRPDFGCKDGKSARPEMRTVRGFGISVVSASRSGFGPFARGRTA